MTYPLVSSDVEKPVRERRVLGVKYGARPEGSFPTSLDANGFKREGRSR